MSTHTMGSHNSAQRNDMFVVVSCSQSLRCRHPTFPSGKHLPTKIARAISALQGPAKHRFGLAFLSHDRPFSPGLVDVRASSAIVAVGEVAREPLWSRLMLPASAA